MARPMVSMFMRVMYVCRSVCWVFHGVLSTIQLEVYVALSLSEGLLRKIMLYVL